MYSEKENFVHVLRRDAPSHVCYPPPSAGALYEGSRPKQPSPDVAEWRDEWGTLWVHKDGEHFPVKGAVDSIQKIGDIHPPDPHKSGRMKPVEEAVATIDRDETFLALTHGHFLYERAIDILAPEEFCMALLAEPAKVHELLDTILDFEIAIAEQYAAFKPDHINLCDDYGHQRQLAMAPATWREFFKPRLKRIIDFYRQHLGPDTVISLHSCGHVMPILEDLVEIGVDILHPVQSAANDLSQLRKITSGRMTLAGGIDGQRILPLGTPDEVREEVFKKMDLLWENGGYLPMPEKMLGVSRENEVAMEQAIRQWSRQNVEKRNAVFSA